ncbi:hypothetical protein AMS68_004319 [Peltaster fructicola]|uniref:Uncharacterized protein n=1 Tax=Peltaster fructicola TaxID=286661 RepID=A0A6H0XVK8_9PEZI|nr:hypothetical protein AMS68_004319 [Peltaster fructicola]
MSKQDAQQPSIEIKAETTSQTRQYWRDPATRILREIWQPGDGDGEPSADYFDKPGPVAPLEKRWRLYLSTLDTIQPGVSEPPRYVVLDDKAAYQVYASDISKQKMTRHWSHDFGGKGGLRSHRIHRGNPAVADAAAEGLDKYGWMPQGKRKHKYYFTGEKDFEPMDSIPDQPVRQEHEPRGLTGNGGPKTTSKRKRQ